MRVFRHQEHECIFGTLNFWENLLAKSKKCTGDFLWQYSSFWRLKTPTYPILTFGYKFVIFENTDAQTLKNASYEFSIGIFVFPMSKNPFIPNLMVKVQI